MLTMFAEVFQDGEWHKVGAEFASTYEELDGILTDRVYDGNNKQLGEFLAYQSYHGLPMDASQEIKENKYFKDDSCVFSTTLYNLLGFEWEMDVYETGYISDWQYRRLRDTGIKPSTIRNSVSFDAVVFSPFMADLVEKRPELIATNNRIFVIYNYDERKFYQTQEFFCDISIPELVDLIPEGGSSKDVRIIFSIT